MDFRRIGKNTVQCRMTEEEVNEYGLEIEDFFTNQEKSREFLETIVEKAEEEIGYHVEHGMVSMQLMRLPDNSLMITFSDHSEDGIASMLQQIQNLAGMIDDETADEIIKGIMNSEENMSGKENITSKDKFSTNKKAKSTTGHSDKKTTVNGKKEKNPPRVYRFSSLEEIEQFSVSLDIHKSISSRIYKDNKDGSYYLLIKKGKLKIDEYQILCEKLQDYGELYSEQMYVEQYLKEHCECLISKHAIKILREYSI